MVSTLVKQDAAFYAIVFILLILMMIAGYYIIPNL